MSIKQEQSGVDAQEPFGSVLPFAEPSWAGSLGHTNPYYNDSHRKLRAFTRKYVDTWIDKAPEWEEKGEVPQEQWQEHSRLGFSACFIQPLDPEYLQKAGITLPAGISPDEWDPFHSMIVADELMRVGYLGTIWGLGGGNSIGGPPIVRFGSKKLKDEILPDLLRGKKRVCLGVTEPQAGSDVAQLKTTAKLSQDGSHFIVNGQKKWITNGIYADYVTAVVRTGEDDSGAGGISVLVIPLTLPGVERKKLYNSGVNASGSTLILFDDVKVPSHYLLGKQDQGFRIVMSNFNGERLALAIQATRMSRICIQDSYAYACKRQVFGKALIAQPVIRAKIADMGRAVERLQAWTEELAHQARSANKKTGDMELAGRVALLKVESGRCLELCNREAQQILGGLSYQKGGNHAGARIEQISRDLRVMVVGGGSDEILTDLGTRMEKMKSDSRL
ncbi:acyl-CoA dehydrogenase NM domain-like protein [Meira miltonrushii]|uniref:Acyl-CoA dehydrogenase NM domain-like protein n=1 Tax=Meira miltonrushii TaxID=1280837 RepID=A0A316VBH5_9BASI|nr:acyl-CoA dehydrogenase NM domain-like protein [Meira miltonrushii]PWN34644.1 acyl-CoA dehydrogenase NM domain-like protein [Meira miltonrushii]